MAEETSEEQAQVEESNPPESQSQSHSSGTENLKVLD